MTTIAANQPAFQTTPEHSCNTGCPGMTVRDYFAAKAMVALITGRTWGHLEDQSSEALMDVWASGSYKLADAMLKAREG